MIANGKTSTAYDWNFFVEIVRWEIRPKWRDASSPSNIFAGPDHFIYLTGTGQRLFMRQEEINAYLKGVWRNNVSRDCPIIKL